MTTIEKEIKSINGDDLAAEFFDNESLIAWYVVVRAAE